MFPRADELGWDVVDRQPSGADGPGCKQMKTRRANVPPISWHNECLVGFCYCCLVRSFLFCFVLSLTE